MNEVLIKDLRKIRKRYARSDSWSRLAGTAAGGTLVRNALEVTRRTQLTPERFDAVYGTLISVVFPGQPRKTQWSFISSIEMEYVLHRWHILRWIDRALHKLGEPLPELHEGNYPQGKEGVVAP
jgi:hypothetical protein